MKLLIAGLSLVLVAGIVGCASELQPPEAAAIPVTRKAPKLKANAHRTNPARTEPKAADQGYKYVTHPKPVLGPDATK